MNKHAIRRGVAGLLAALTLLQGAALTALAAENQEPSVEAVTMAEPQLQNGAAVIPAGADKATVKELLCKALVANADQVDAQELEWEYYCTGKNGLLTNDAWGSVNGFSSETKFGLITTTYTHPALADNGDGSYQVRLAGDTGNGVTLTKAAKLSSSITLHKGRSVALPYNEDATLNYDALRESIFDTVVASTTPDLTVNDVTIKYYATAESGSLGNMGKAWMPLEGGKDTLTYPAISTGEQKIRISYAGTDSIYGTSAETTVTITERPEAPYTLKETPEAVTLAVGEDMKVDYDALHNAIFNAVVASSDVLTADNVTVTYYYKGITELDSKWLPLEGQAVVGSVGYPAISAGEQKVKISFAGNQTYAPTTIEATITVKDREQGSSSEVPKGFVI